MTAFIPMVVVNLPSEGDEARASTMNVMPSEAFSKAPLLPLILSWTAGTDESTDTQTSVPKLVIISAFFRSINVPLVNIPVFIPLL